MRMLMFLEEDGTVYKFNTFFPKAVEDHYNQMLQSALLSIVNGKEIEEDAEISIAKIENNFEKIIYSRDGNFPTHSEDALIVEEIRIKNLKAILPKKILEDTVNSLLPDNESDGYSVSPLSNGKVYSKKAETTDKKVIVKSMTNKPENTGILLKCYGNGNLDINEVNALLSRTYLGVSPN